LQLNSKAELREEERSKEFNKDFGEVSKILKSGKKDEGQRDVGGGGGWLCRKRKS